MLAPLALLLALLVFVNGCSIRWRLEAEPVATTKNDLSLSWWRKTTKPPLLDIPSSQTIRDEQQFKAVLAQDDQAMQQISRWLDESREVRRKDPSFAFELGQQIRRRLKKVRIAYEDFLKHHPDHNGARSAFASFLTCMRDEQGALTQWNRALLSDDKNAAAWNNLANYYGSLALEGDRRDYIQRAFNAYDQALAVTPGEPLYHNNLAVALGLEDFRREAAAHYQIPEDKILERALEHFKKCHSLAPDNFIYAADLAEAYLSVRPLRKAKAHAMWQKARKLTEDSLQLQWVELQVAFLEIEDGQYAKAELLLKKVTDPSLNALKAKVVAAIQAVRKQ